MTEVMFYHLERTRLEQALPKLLEKCLERGWRVAVQAGSRERIEALDAHLWTYADESFLPHGMQFDAAAGDQPILLAIDRDNVNAAQVRFIVDRAAPPDDLSDYERVVFMFSGDDDDALAEARSHWRAVKDKGHEVTYWQQNGRGKWEKKA